jgi:hypothetical protein
MPRTRELIQEIVGLLEGDDDLQLEFARAFLTSRTLRRLFQADPELQETLRRLILTDALLQLPEKVEPLLQLPEKIEPLLQLPERVEALEAAVSELRAIVNRIEPVVNRIEPIVNRIEPAVMELQRWQQGEVARRKGDDYERLIIQRAGRIFGMGQGGSPRDDASVRQQILMWLDAAGLLDEEEDPASDPLEADLDLVEGRARRVGGNLCQGRPPRCAPCEAARRDAAPRWANRHSRCNRLAVGASPDAENRTTRGR